MDSYLQSTVETDRFQMDYIKFGHGDRPFVVLPGSMFRPLSFYAAGIADAFASFGDSYTVYALSRRRNLPEKYTVWEMADDTVAALGQLGVRNADIFGASLGGMIALAIAAAYPDVPHGVIVSSALGEQNPVSIRVFDEWLRQAEEEAPKTLVKHAFSQIFSASYCEQNHCALEAFAAETSQQDADRFAREIYACRHFDIGDQSDRIRCHALIVGATGDNTLTGDASVRIAEKIGCQCVLYDGYSHAVYDEAPDFRPQMRKALAAFREEDMHCEK